jgi:hypothetical protein
LEDKNIKIDIVELTKIVSLKDRANFVSDFGKLVISFEGPTAYDAKASKKLEGRDNSFNAAIDYGTREDN